MDANVKPVGLADLIAAVNTHEGSWGKSQMIWDEGANAYQFSRNDSQLAWDVDFFLWATYDANNDLIYPNVNSWDDLLERTMENDGYSNLDKDQVLSILFGLHHRTRVVDGLWTSMFERGIMQKLLGRLMALDTDKY